MNTSIDIQEQIENLLNEQESEDLEFKSAKGGLPDSLWETYSAFANTHGGLIVLGIKEEAQSKKMTLAGLSEEQVERMKGQLFRQLRNRQKVSACLLTDKDVRIKNIEGNYLLCIQVPQAARSQRPIYINGDPERGSYRRNGEGDYHCTPEEVRRMFADSDPERPADCRILKGFTWDDIDLDSLEQYRRLFRLSDPSHVWHSEDDQSLMKKLGGYRIDKESGEEGFTLAGLLMFGKIEAIQDLQCAPHYFPDYRSIPRGDSDQRWVDRIYPDGRWEANLFQFYRRVLPKLREALPTPFTLDGNQRMDETPAHVALREAFVNCCVHADYGENTSLQVLCYPDRILFSNPGTLLISRQQYYEGGESVCRNPSLQKMFMKIGAAERAGSGTSKIFSGWKSIGWKAPYPQEESKPNKVTLLMPLESLLDKRIEDALLVQLGKERWYQLDQDERMILSTAYTEKIINHQCIRASSTLHPTDITHRLRHLVREGYLSSQGHGRGTTYTLASPEEYSMEGADTLWSNMESSELNMESLPPNMESSIPNMESSRRTTGTSEPNMGSSRPNIGTSDANIGTSPSNMGTSKANIGSPRPNIGSSETNMGSSQPYIGTSGLNMESSRSNIGSSEGNMGSSQSNIGSSESSKPSRMSFDKMRLLILEYCGQWRSLEEIASHTERTKEYLGSFILPKLSEDLRKRFSQKNHPNQMYRRSDVVEEEPDM